MSAGERLLLEERLHRFVDELRARGLPVSMVERVDAMRAVAGTDLSHPTRLHTELGATLVKDVDHLAVFDDVFELFFRTAAPPPTGGRAAPLDLDDALRTVLRTGAGGLTRAVAEQAVTQFADVEPGRRVAGVLYQRRTERGLRLAETVEQLTGDTTGDTTDAGEGSGRGGGDGAAGVVHDHAEALRRQLVQVIRERMIADRGPADVARVLRTPLLADVDLTAATVAQLEQIDRTMPVLQRKLATVLLRRRRRARGHLDVRATLRRSMGTGGVPVTLVEHPRRPTRPQLVLLADMSGSVANFAAFSVSLMAAMAPLFTGFRTFAFVRDAVEVTEVVRGARSSKAAARAVTTVLAPTSLGGSTDYGRALTTFRDAVSDSLGHRTTVIVLGDARGNHRAPHSAALADVARRSRALYWLNPEPVRLWGTGDSLAPVYAPHCTDMVACRTVADLRRFVERLA